MALVKARGLRKTYSTGEIEVQAIRGVDLDIDEGAFVSFVGPSGSGKSTLLNMIGCLDSPSQGYLSVAGQDVSTMDRRQAADFRGKYLGFIFQDFNLMPVLSVYENIEYPLLMVQKWSPANRKKRVTELLEAIGMADQANKLPSQVSGGQKQRVAVARALVANPRLILADEPTANLDKETSYRIIALMKQMRDEFKTTFIFSTHDPRVVENAEIIHTLEDGRITSTHNGSGGSNA